MGFLESFVSFIVYLASTCGYGGIFILNMLEYACLPFPSEIVLPAIGANLASGKYSMIYALPISIIGGVVGTLISYSVGMYAGEKVISFAKRKHKKSKSIFEKIDRLFSRYGKITVFLARLLPFTRTYISLFAGAEKVNKIMFVIFSALGITIMTILTLLILIK
ncbi:DedA family protein [Clostridium perfringens]|uniref:DedA family protein n=1 Tax=Clostridium perfringens TaxID=1502 RepID=UPI00375461EF